MHILMTTPPGLRRLVLKRSQPIDPRKTPTQSRSEYTYGVILQASLDLLARGGLEGFTTNAVAKRASVSVGSLYQYFPNSVVLMNSMSDLDILLTPSLGSDPVPVGYMEGRSYDFSYD